MQLLTVHVDGVAVEAGTPRDRDPPEATATVRAEDALVAGVGVAAGDPDPTGAAVAAARTVRDRADHLSVEVVLVVPAPSLVDAPAGAERTARTTDAVVEWVRAPPADDAADPDPGTVERAPVGYHLAIEGTVRGHPHAVRRHDVPPDPPAGTPPRPGGPAPTWRRVDGHESAGSPSQPDPGRPAQEPPTLPDSDPNAAVTDRLDSVPGLCREGAWLPGGVAARRAVERTAADCLGCVGAEAGLDRYERPLLYDRATGGAAPWRSSAAPVGRRWLERSPPGDERPTLHVRTGAPASTLASACTVLGEVARRLGVTPEFLVRGGDASAVAAAVDGAVFAGPDSPGERRVDASVVDPRTGLALGRAWSTPAPTTVHAAVGPPASGLAAARAATTATGRPLPAWVAPTTCRLVPVAERHRGDCLDLAAVLRERGVRADCDERSATVATRLDRVDAERLPFHAVVGDRELDAAPDLADTTLPLVGPDGRQRSTAVDSLVDTVAAAVDGTPTADPAAVPLRVSRVAETASDESP